MPRRVPAAASHVRQARVAEIESNPGAVSAVPLMKVVSALQAPLGVKKTLGTDGPGGNYRAEEVGRHRSCALSGAAGPRCRAVVLCVEPLAVSPFGIHR